MTLAATQSKGIEFRGVTLGPAQPNDLSYLEIKDWRTCRPMGDRILVDWEEKRGDLLGGKLLQPDTHKKMHYTGIVLAVGPDVDPAIAPGMRILFDQFSGFEKLWHPEVGRMALISERAQASAFAIIPYRLHVGEGEPDYNYDA